MTDKDYQEFIDLTMNMYANRDAYSRGKIIEDLRDKVSEIYNKVTTTQPQKVCAWDNILHLPVANQCDCNSNIECKKRIHKP